MQRRSIRFRLTAWYAAILVAGLGLFGGLIWFSLRHRLLVDVDRQLEGSAARFEKYFASESSEASGGQLRDELYEFCQALPPGNYIYLRGASGFQFRHPVDAPPASSDFPVDFRALRRQFVASGEAFDLEVRAPIGDVLHTLDLLRLLLFSLLPVVIAIACAGGAWLSRRALRPVQDVTAAALNISIGNLSDRLPDSGTGDELAQLTEVLNAMLARLEAAVKTLSQFVGDASHELRTPLTVIRTTAELALRRARTAESYRESLQEVAAETERMTQLVEDLLTLARSDAGTDRLPLQPVDLRSVLGEVLAGMRALAEMREIRLTSHPGDAPAAILGNGPALHRLFLVLLDNAFKHSRPGGEVIAAIERSAASISVSVEDFGPGIAAADLPHIFTRFYRADPARSGGGHGLGLSLAESIARAHGATIEVRSTAGSGSRFSVVFPACGAPETSFSESSDFTV